MKVIPTKIVAFDPRKTGTERKKEVALHSIIDVHRVRNEKPEPLEYVIDGHLRAGIPAVLAAPGGVGKTWFGLELGICLASPRANAVLLRLPLSKPGGCLYLSAEDDEQELRHRLSAILSLVDDAAADEIHTRFHARPLAGDGVSLGSAAWVDAIVTAALAVPDLKLIVLDTLSTLTAGIEENDNTALATVVDTIKEIIKKARCSRRRQSPCSSCIIRKGMRKAKRWRYPRWTRGCQTSWRRAAPA